MAADVQACLAFMVRFALFIVCKAKKHLYFYINICVGRHFCVSNATRPACQTLAVSPMDMDNNSYAIRTLSEMADDFLLAIIAIKHNDKTNESLPFLHAHALELAAKTASYHFGIDIKKRGHDIMSIYSLLESHIPNIKTLVPTRDEFETYRKTWLVGNSVETSFDIKNPEELFRLELAFYIDNVTNLKYGITKENIQVSLFDIFYKEINEHFLRVFITCRKTYMTDSLNTRFKKKIFGAVGQNVETEKKCDDLLNFV